MSPAEIAWRVRSLLREQTDIVRIPLGFLPALPRSAQVTFEDFEPGYACSPVTPAENQFDSLGDASRARATLLAKADDALANRLSYFDLESHDHGDPMQWHRDHSAVIDSPVRLCAFTDYRDFKTYGDCKLVWEPNRHHQFVVLARAYVISGKPEYAEKIAEQMRSWIDANPFGYGMNWKSPLELGVRIINWVWALDLIRGSNAIDDELWHDVQQSMYLAMWDGQRKFSRGSSANNHLIGEAAGVFVGACYFRSFPHADNWARKSQEVLEREIQRQTFVDGGTAEHAFGYQFFVIQFFSLCMMAGEAAGHPFSTAFKDRLHKMYRFLFELSSDTGAPPNSGDRDDGYVLDLGNLPEDAAELLAVGGELFSDPVLCQAGASETVFWLTGRSTHSLPPGSDSGSSCSFPDAGYHILRGARSSVYIDCAELGYGPIAAHGHADCLAICYSLDGQSLLVDPGTYDYFTHPDWRDYFRETRAHNTVEIDAQNQSELQGPFMWGDRANATLLEWRDDEVATILEGEHDGYTALADPAIHRRRLTLDKPTDELTIVDSIVCKGAHAVRLHFHVDPACDVERIGTGEVKIKRGDATCLLSSDDGAFECIAATDQTELGWISPSYHRRLPSNCIRMELNITGDTRITTVLKPA